MRDDCPAEGAGGVGRAVPRQRPQTGFTEDVVARVTHVRAEVHVQAHRTDVAFSLSGPSSLIGLAAAAAAGHIPCGPLVNEGDTLKTLYKIIRRVTSQTALSALRKEKPKTCKSLKQLILN